MKEPESLDIGDCLADFKRFDTIIDARSESEYALDHLPGAISAPVLNDEERALVGTLYKQVGSFEAKRVGAALVARNVARHLETLFANRPRQWKPLIYCWRGGNRSGAMATILARIGWHTSLLEGGYRAFRRQVNSELETRPGTLRFHVLAGRTGSAKTAILAELSALGAQVLDLEGLARHRGSVLGAMPDEAQPPQKWFETQVWQALRAFDPSRPVYVEAESKKVGQIHVPEPLIQAMRASRLSLIEADLPIRIEHLMTEYRYFFDDTPDLEQRLESLRTLHGGERLDRWRQLIAARNWPELVAELLSEHYDPSYDRSIRRNFRQFDEAPTIRLAAADAESIRQAARQLLADTSDH